MKDVLFHDGEGIDFADFNAAQRLAVQAVADAILPVWVDPPAYSAMDLRPVDNALAVTTVSATQVQVGPGRVLGRIAQPVDANDHGLAVHHLESGVQITIPANTSTTDERWDIIQAKIERVNGGSEARDFKDATTGALSSQTLDKRRQTVLTINRKEGGFFIEPAPDAGFIKLARVRVPINSGALTADSVEDFRRPAGYRRILHTPTDCHFVGGTVPGTSHTVGDNGEISFGASKTLRIPLRPGAYLSRSGGNVHRFAGRLAALRLSGEWDSGDLFNLFRVQTLGSSTGGANTSVRNISSLVTRSGLGVGSISDIDITAGDTGTLAYSRSIWSNGRLNPNDTTTAADLDAYLILQIATSATAGNRIFRGLASEWWGL